MLPPAPILPHIVNTAVPAHSPDGATVDAAIAIALQPRVGFVKPKRSEFICGKGHTLDIAPPSKETSSHIRSGMARVVEGFHSFTCTPTRLSTNGMNHICLCLPSRSWSLFTEPVGMEG